MPYIGESLPRTGDRRLLTGTGRYVDDVRIPGTAHAAFVRSPHAHARVVGIDATAALALPGVLAVYSGADVAEMMTPQVAAAEMLPGRSIQRWPLATDRVRFVGDPVAVVVAEDGYVARDAAELVAVEYEPLPAVATAEAALVADAPILHEGWESNAAFRWEKVSGDPDRVLTEAERVVEVRLVNNRIHAAFIEPRAILASPTLGMAI